MAQAAYTTLVESLERELAAQRRVVDFYENYYFGDHQLQAVRKKWEEVYGGALPEMTSNWCELAVNAAAGRLKVEGIIFPTQTGELGEDGGPGGQPRRRFAVGVRRGRGTLEYPLLGGDHRVHGCGRVVRRVDPHRPT